jgi:hypothetical protein
MSSTMTNLERIAIAIQEFGPDVVNIHTVPNSEYWVVMYQTAKSKPNWRVIICNPMLTTYRLVTDHVTPEDYVEMWEKLTDVRLGGKLSQNVEELRKCAEDIKQNKSIIVYEHKLLKPKH